jgi:uncharacterized membrane protein
VIEILAAALGASISVAAMGMFGFSRRNEEASAAIVRLTSAVEHIANSLEILHVDIKQTNREMFTRLNQVENRVSKLEVK